MASMTMISTVRVTVQADMTASPARARTRMISSGPYALELMLSELKMARALTLVSRSCSSCSDEMGRPNRNERTPRNQRPTGPAASIAFSEAIS